MCITSLYLNNEATIIIILILQILEVNNLNRLYCQYMLIKDLDKRRLSRHLIISQKQWQNWKMPVIWTEYTKM